MQNENHEILMNLNHRLTVLESNVDSKLNEIDLSIGNINQDLKDNYLPILEEVDEYCANLKKSLPVILRRHQRAALLCQDSSK